MLYCIIYIFHIYKPIKSGNYCPFGACKCPFILVFGFDSIRLLSFNLLVYSIIYKLFLLLYRCPGTQATHKKKPLISVRLYTLPVDSGRLAGSCIK
jgi:hypothetical protein